MANRGPNLKLMCKGSQMPAARTFTVTLRKPERTILRAACSGCRDNFGGNHANMIPVHNRKA